MYNLPAQAILLLMENIKYQTMKLPVVLYSHEVVKKRLDDTSKTLERQM